MYALKWLLAFLLMYFLYKAEDNVSVFTFISAGISGIIICFATVSTRNQIYQYLERACYDNIPGYDYRQSVNFWIDLYDKVLYVSVATAVIIGIVCILATFTGNNILDNSADILTYTVAFVMPVIMVVFSIKYSGKYVDPGKVFFPAEIKGELVLACSIVIRKIIKVLKNR